MSLIKFSVALLWLGRDGRGYFLVKTLFRGLVFYIAMIAPGLACFEGSKRAQSLLPRGVFRVGKFRVDEDIQDSIDCRYCYVDKV